MIKFLQPRNTLNYNQIDLMFKDKLPKHYKHIFLTVESRILTREEVENHYNNFGQYRAYNLYHEPKILAYFTELFESFDRVIIHQNSYQYRPNQIIHEPCLYVKNRFKNKDLWIYRQFLIEIKKNKRKKNFNFYCEDLKLFLFFVKLSTRECGYLYLTLQQGEHKFYIASREDLCFHFIVDERYIDQLPKPKDLYFL
jgi:hypothetical protein